MFRVSGLQSGTSQMMMLAEGLDCRAWHLHEFKGLGFKFKRPWRGMGVSGI